MKNLVCPISFKKIDSNVSRLTGLLSVSLMGGFLITLNPLFIVIVTLDYFIRAMLDVRYSPFRFIAAYIVGLLKLKKKAISRLE